MLKRIAMFPLLALSLSFLPACATGGAMEAEPGEAGDQVIVRVNNNLIPPAAITVSIVPDIGVQQLLGAATPSETATFEYEAAAAVSQYRLVAEPTGRPPVVSREFVLTDDAAVVEWDLNLGTIRVLERED